MKDATLKNLSTSPPPLSSNEAASLPESLAHDAAHAKTLTQQLQQAKTLTEQLCHALKTSHKLVNALLDGSSNDKTIGKYILQTAKETDAIWDAKTHKALLHLLDKSILTAQEIDR